MLKISHRGAWGLEPENTLRSFRLALNYEVDMIETDVRLTKDNNLILFHDSDLKRLYNINKRIEELSLNEIKEINEEIPFLDELFNLI